MKREETNRSNNTFPHTEQTHTYNCQHIQIIFSPFYTVYEITHFFTAYRITTLTVILMSTCWISSLRYKRECNFFLFPASVPICLLLCVCVRTCGDVLVKHNLISCSSLGCMSRPQYVGCHFTAHNQSRSFWVCVINSLHAWALICTPVISRHANKPTTKQRQLPMWFMQWRWQNGINACMCGFNYVSVCLLLSN